MYYTEAKIQVIDEAQDSEMALPTAMTILIDPWLILKMKWAY